MNLRSRYVANKVSEKIIEVMKKKKQKILVKINDTDNLMKNWRVSIDDEEFRPWYAGITEKICIKIKIVTLER